MLPISDREEAELCRARAAHLRAVAARIARPDTCANTCEDLLEAASFWEFLADLADRRASKSSG